MLDLVSSKERRCPECRTGHLTQLGNGVALVCEFCWVSDLADAASWLKPAFVTPFAGRARA